MDGSCDLWYVQLGEDVSKTVIINPKEKKKRQQNQNMLRQNLVWKRKGLRVTGTVLLVMVLTAL